MSYEQAAAWAERRIVVLPAEARLAAGQQVTFRVQETGAPARTEGKEAKAAAQWRWQAWDEDRPVKTAPLEKDTCTLKPGYLPRVRRFRIRATSIADPSLWGEATALVLPREIMLLNQRKGAGAEPKGFGPGECLRELLGDDWTAPIGTRPFMEIEDPETVADAFRPDPEDLPPLPDGETRSPEDFAAALESTVPRLGPAGARVARSVLPVLDNPIQYVGYGRPSRLAWAAQPGATGQMLTLRDSSQVRSRHDVTGRDSLDVTLPQAAVFAVETLQERWGVHESHLQTGHVRVLGLSPGLAPGAGPRQPAGMVRPGDPTRGQQPLVIADTAGNALWITDGGPGDAPRRLCGSPQGDAGLVNLGGEHARFHGPTYLAQRPLTGDGQPAWEVYVSDTQNHCIRRVLPGGNVSILAGTGQAGFQDGPAAQARFNRPMGLACDRDCTLYVADQGNHRIRRITPAGVVSTLAGGQDGTADGDGAAAQFRNLKGLGLVPWTGRTRMLVQLDGHAVRRLNVASGHVHTVLGQVDAPGSRTGAEPLGMPPAERQARLSDPTDLFIQASNLHSQRILWRGFIADTGNHALRQLELVLPHGQAPFARWSDVVGDPSRNVTAPGLARFGLPWFPEAGYATLAAPGYLAADGPGGILVGSGTAILRAGLPDDFATTRLACSLLEIRCEPAVAGSACLATIQVPMHPTGKDGVKVTEPLEWWVDFLNPDGSLAQSHQGAGQGCTPFQVVGGFDAPGQGKIRVRAITSEGMTVWGDLALDIAGKAGKEAKGRAMDTSTDEGAGSRKRKDPPVDDDPGRSRHRDKKRRLE